MAHRWHGKEGRWGERVKVNIPPVQVSAGALAGADGCMKNLSLSGALVQADVDLGLHSLIILYGACIISDAHNAHHEDLRPHDAA
jgi:hypothetical protein